MHREWKKIIKKYMRKSLITVEGVKGGLEEEEEEGQYCLAQ